MARQKTDTSALMTAGLNLIQQALSIYDSDLRLSLCNRRFQEMFDLPDALVTPGAEFSETIRHLAATGEYGDVDDIEAFVTAREDQARAFEPHYMERTRANGRTISVEGAPLPQGGWVTVYTDISPAKRQEALLRARSEELSGQLVEYSEELAAANRELQATNAALEEAKRELMESEARTRLTTEMMPAHIAHVNLDRRYTYSNRRLNSVMPGRPSDIIGRHIAETLGRQAFSRIEQRLNDAFDGRPSVFEFSDEISSRRIRVAFTPDTSAEDGITGVYILSMDVTEESQARAALQQTRRREMAAQLTSGVAHDFSNLLTIILGMQSRLQKMPLPSEAGELIDATLSAARRGGALLNQIADITAPRSENPRTVDLKAMLHDLEVLARSSMPEGVELEFLNEAPLDPVFLDPGMLQDSLLNLILNAQDACDGSGRVRLRAKTVRDTWLEFTVTDTGKGFSDAALKHAFDPFFTTKGDQGTGLGLAMVYDMTKLAGGEVRVSNAYSGARVTLRLPLRQPAQPVDHGLVVLVEDDPDLRAAIRDMLRGLGNTVVEAASADEAQSLVSGLPQVSLVLSDIQLKGDATGIDLIDRLPPTLPVVLMSSLPPSHDLWHQAAARAPLLRKPFTADDLSAALHQKAAE